MLILTTSRKNLVTSLPLKKAQLLQQQHPHLTHTFDVQNFTGFAENMATILATVKTRSETTSVSMKRRIINNTTM
jgi:hypothetical protein